MLTRVALRGSRDSRSRLKGEITRDVG